MRNATLVFSARPGNRDLLVFPDFTSGNNLIDAIFALKKPTRTDRLVFENGKIYYKQSEEYKSFVVRMKKIK